MLLVNLASHVPIQKELGLEMWHLRVLFFSSSDPLSLRAHSSNPKAAPSALSLNPRDDVQASQHYHNHLQPFATIIISFFSATIKWLGHPVGRA